MSQALAQHKIEVQLTASPDRSYPIIVGKHLLDTLGEQVLELLKTPRKVLIITDTTVGPLYLEKIEEQLASQGFKVFSLIIPAGEHSKNLTQAQTIYETLAQKGFSRQDVLLGLGGGVVGDLTGFCSATFHRGMKLIHVPTTLVAQVDSAIGGKTAVNLEHLKNMVGCFYQPIAVLSDTSTLHSLPARELAAGMAEVIKYGLIETSCNQESGFFEWMEQHLPPGKNIDYASLVQRCARIKADVVMRDELETKGLRFFLNLGHTFGHAYETLSEYRLLHGEAVALGMLRAVELAIDCELVDSTLKTRLEQLYHHVGLGALISQPQPFAPDDLIAVMRHDKKNAADRIRLILPTGNVGDVIARDDIPVDKIRQVYINAAL